MPLDDLPTDAKAEAPSTQELPFTYAQLLETNNLIQQNADESYWLCVTRTVQESKLFPVPAYMLMSYLMAFYRYPELIRKIEAQMPAEAIADRAREMGMKIQNPSVSWGLPCFYLLGREWLINMGLLRPTDAVEDLITVMDFWKRYELSWHRNDGHLTNADFGHRAQILPERTIQVFHADLYDCADGDPLHTAAQAFMAAVSQYGFLVSCESRISLHNSGPYKLTERTELLVRDFMDLSESDFPWLDDVASGIEYNNLTVTMEVKDSHFYIVDDWGSFEAEPEFKAANLVGIGLYTSDNLSGGHIPVGMGSAEELKTTLLRLTDQIKDATTKLWRRMAAWSRDEMVDAGAITYFAICKDLAHVAGVYDVDDWMTIDPRAERFRPMLNDEYSRDALAELVGHVSCPSQRLSAYDMARHSNQPQRMYSLLPYSLLAGEPFTRSSGPLRLGTSHLGKKKDVYTTTKGRMSLAEYNRLSREATGQAGGRDAYLCQNWVKYNARSEEADALYKTAQRHSRRLADRGAGLTREDVEALRRGEDRAAASPGLDLPALHRVLHMVALHKHADAGRIAAGSGLPPEELAEILDNAVETGRLLRAKGSFMLSAPAQAALKAEYSRFYLPLRHDEKLAANYERFEAINRDLKEVISSWQTIEVGGKSIPNDHTDDDHDNRVLDKLAALHDAFEPVLTRFIDAVPRLESYREKLTAALEKAEDGEKDWVSDARLESYHTVWFVMHEDLLRIFGRERRE